ncbi:hypothetical protein CAAN1_08S04610 [[Candida] anglica]|uniref:Uncharacterized protein n=1 Tax=[Candida] anglica TaxID=148631 RepID=A0ABP0E5L3_9ASCO
MFGSLFQGVYVPQWTHVFGKGHSYALNVEHSQDVHGKGAVFGNTDVREQLSLIGCVVVGSQEKVLVDFGNVYKLVGKLQSLFVHQRVTVLDFENKQTLDVFHKHSNQVGSETQDLEDRDLTFGLLGCPTSRGIVERGQILVNVLTEIGLCQKLVLVPVPKTDVVVPTSGNKSFAIDVQTQSKLVVAEIQCLTTYSLG